MTGTSSSGDSAKQEKANSPEFVQKVAEKVYALWLKDLQIERERRHSFGSRQNWSKRR